MADKLNNDAELCEKLIPRWELGCRRVTPGAGYLESFLRPNVHLTQSPIARITKDSVVTADGQEYKVDVGKRVPLSIKNKDTPSILTGSDSCVCDRI